MFFDQIICINFFFEEFTEIGEKSITLKASSKNIANRHSLLKVSVSVHLFIDLAFSNILRTSSNYCRGRQDKNALYCLQQYIGSGAVTGPLFPAVTFTILYRKTSGNEKRRCRLEKSQSNLKSVHFRAVFENLFKLATALFRGALTRSGRIIRMQIERARFADRNCTEPRIFLLPNILRMLPLRRVASSLVPAGKSSPDVATVKGHGLACSSWQTFCGC